MHIYVGSQLYKADPTRWGKLIEELKETREFKLMPYAPLRHAVVSEIESPGSGKAKLRRRLESIEKLVGYDLIANTSRIALRNFIRNYSDTLVEVKNDLLSPSYNPAVVEFAGNPLEGRFHFHAITSEGDDAYVYVHASKWTENQVVAAVEFLTILAEEQFGADRSQVWFLDLRTGDRIKPAKAYKRLRIQLGQVSELYHTIASFAAPKKIKVMV